MERFRLVLLPLLLLACVTVRAEMRLEGRFLAPGETLLKSEVPALLMPYPVLPPSWFWRELATERKELTITREVFFPEERFVLRYPAGKIKLYYQDGDVYGEYGNFLFLLPDSALSREGEGEFRDALSRPFILNAFRRLMNHPVRPYTPPVGGKARYTQRLTSLPLRRGGFLPDHGGVAELKQAAAAGAVLLQIRVGERPGELLDAAKAANVTLLYDASALSGAVLFELIRNYGEHPALAGIVLGGAPGVYGMAAAVREITDELPLYVSADMFCSPEAFQEFQAFPLENIIYTADVHGVGGTLPKALLDFQRRSGAMISVRVVKADNPFRFIDAVEKQSWEWCAPFPGEAPYTRFYLRNR